MVLLKLRNKWRRGVAKLEKDNALMQWPQSEGGEPTGGLVLRRLLWKPTPNWRAGREEAARKKAEWWNSVQCAMRRRTGTSAPTFPVRLMAAKNFLSSNWKSSFFNFFKTRTSEQHPATVDLVFFFIISYRFRLNTDFIREFKKTSVETYFIANGYSTNHVPAKVRTAETPTNT